MAGRRAIPAALVAVATYVYIAWLMTVFVDRGATELLYVVTLIAYVNACKYATLAVFTPLLFLREVVRGRTPRPHNELAYTDSEDAV